MQVRIDNELREGVHAATHDTDKDPFRAYVVVGGQYDETFTALTENEVASARMTMNRGIHMNLRDASGNEIGTSGSPVRVDPTGTTSQTVAPATSVVDANNSTTSTLNAGIAFEPINGTDVEGYSTVTIQLFADQDSATDGMQFQFSTDDSNWDDVYSFTLDISSSQARRFQFPVTAKYFRVSYTNGGTNQGAFRVQTMLHRSNALTSIHRVGDVFTADRSCTVTKSSLIGQDAIAGDFKNIKTYDAAGSFTSMLVVPVDASANPFECLAAQADTVANTVNGQLTSSMGYGFNGSTWDRLRSSIANGLEVDVTQSALPSGAATAGNQLPDGHAVTVDNTTGSPVPTQEQGKPVAATVTHTEVNVLTSNTVVLASGNVTQGGFIVNNGINNVYISIGTAAALNQGIKLAPQYGIMTLDINGFPIDQAINGIAETGTSEVLITYA